MTKYCTDLMEAQEKSGHEVGVLWPGTIHVIRKKTYIVKHSDWNKIKNYELINPLPVPLDEGIRNIPYFTKNCSDEIYKAFFNEFKPDIIHIHTLFGLHKSFLKAAEINNIKLVFTIHDYFPLCPKVTLFYHNKICSGKQYEHCVICNQTALPLWKIYLLQSDVYRYMKDLYFVKKMRRHHRRKFFGYNLESISKKQCMPKPNDYLEFKKYYISYMENMDMILYNSTLTRDIHTSFYKSKADMVMCLSHNDIVDRRIKQENHSNLSLVFLSGTSTLKGFDLLLSSLDQIIQEGFCKFTLHVYGQVSEKRIYLKCHGQYVYEDLPKIFQEADVLVSISAGYESFGFTVLEAISYGIPVITSTNTGAKDVVKEMNAGWIIDPNVKELSACIKKLYLDRALISKAKEHIVNSDVFLDYNTHVQRVINIYRDVISTKNKLKI